jgi:peptidoglycan/xylan/chitin deacetylase (PgdA/CDA1 family)
MKSIGLLARKIGSKLGLAPAMLRARRNAPPVILMYHGVSDGTGTDACDCEAKHVAAPLFREQLQFLASCRRVVPLGTLVESLRAGKDTGGMLAITFDDGYLNNATTAAPILSETGVPATFFLATGFLNERRWLWNDRIEAILHRTTRTSVFAPILGEEIALAQRSDRCAAVRRIKRPLKKLSWQDAEQQIIALESALGIEPRPPTGLYEFMSWEHARGLAKAGFEVGAHTVNHAILSRVGTEEAQREILTSRDQVAAATGGCSPTFCYPNGKHSDYNPAVADFCRTHFDAALSAEMGVARAGDLFDLRRVPVDNRTSVPFLARMILTAD